MRLREAKRIQYGEDVITRMFLRITADRGRHGGGRITAGIERNATVATREMPNLGLPTSRVTRKFVHEHDGCAHAGVFVIQRYVISRRDLRHHGLLFGRLSQGVGILRQRTIPGVIAR